MYKYMLECMALKKKVINSTTTAVVPKRCTGMRENTWLRNIARGPAKKKNGKRPERNDEKSTKTDITRARNDALARASAYSLWYRDWKSLKYAKPPLTRGKHRKPCSPMAARGGSPFRPRSIFKMHSDPHLQTPADVDSDLRNKFKNDKSPRASHARSC